MAPKTRKGFYIDGKFVLEGSAEAERADAGEPSRTARKNASTELQKVGEDLVALRADALERLDLPERLLDAIVEAKRLTNFGARRRQVQFIGKMMRKLDPEALDAIEAALRASQPGYRGPRDGRT